MIQKKEVRTITVGLVAQWIVSAFFSLLGLITLVTSIMSGFIILVCSIFLNPYVEKKMQEKFNLQFSRGLKVILLFVIVIAFFAGLTSSDQSDSKDELVETCTLKNVDKVCLNAIKERKNARLLLENGEILFTFNENGNLLQQNKIVVYKNTDGSLQCKNGTTVKSDYECIEGEALKLMGIFATSNNEESSSTEEDKKNRIEVSRTNLGTITNNEYLSSSYFDLQLLFGSSSKYTELQKERMFEEQYKGEYVKWRGEVIEVDSTFGSLKLYVQHQDNPFDFFNVGDVTVNMRDDQYETLLSVKKADFVTYFGRLDDFSSSHFYLEDGQILQ